MKSKITVYECLNPSFNDMSLDEQIEAKINDWCAEDDKGQAFFGQTYDEALSSARAYSKE